MCVSAAGTYPRAASFDCLHGVKLAQFEMPDFWKLDPTSAEKTGGQGARPDAERTFPGHEARAGEGCMGQLRRRFMAPALEGGDGLQGHRWSEPAENSGFVPHPLTTVLIIRSSYTHEAAGNTSCSAPRGTVHQQWYPRHHSP